MSEEYPKGVYRHESGCVIFKMLDGRFFYSVTIQDGNERGWSNTLEESIQAVKQCQRVMNNTKVKRKHITYLQEADVMVRQFVPWNPKQGGE